MNWELVTMKDVADYLRCKQLQVTEMDGRLNVTTIQGTDARVCIITQHVKDIDQMPSMMLMFTVPMADMRDFRDFGSEQRNIEALSKFLYRALDLSSGITMSPFSIVILSTDDGIEDEIVALRASLVSATFEFSQEDIRLMIDQMELALAACEDLMGEYFEMSVEERATALA